MTRKLCMILLIFFVIFFVSWICTPELSVFFQQYNKIPVGGDPSCFLKKIIKMRGKNQEGDTTFHIYSKLQNFSELRAAVFLKLSEQKWKDNIPFGAPQRLKFTREQGSNHSILRYVQSRRAAEMQCRLSATHSDAVIWLAAFLGTTHMHAAFWQWGTSVCSGCNWFG